DEKCGGFAGAGLGLADGIVAAQRVRQYRCLNRRTVLKAEIGNTVQQPRVETEIVKTRLAFSFRYRELLGRPILRRVVLCVRLALAAAGAPFLCGSGRSAGRLDMIGLRLCCMRGGGVVAFAAHVFGNGRAGKGFKPFANQGAVSGLDNKWISFARVTIITARLFIGNARPCSVAAQRAHLPTRCSGSAGVSISGNSSSRRRVRPPSMTMRACRRRNCRGSVTPHECATTSTSFTRFFT